ncbi:hypothetical protein U9M48_004563 [Paspalum notatum var. saurae]|uniref:Uncharacterized protein n=1 Tax=Paspalum notatum var. saurae TaxID=547442 RepID=A0AAQ3PK52_PASNO
MASRWTRGISWTSPTTNSRADADPVDAAADPEGLPLLLGLPARCPPSGESAVVLYMTTLCGVRRTLEASAAGVAVRKASALVGDGGEEGVESMAAPACPPCRAPVRLRARMAACQAVETAGRGRCLPLCASAMWAPLGNEWRHATPLFHKPGCTTVLAFGLMLLVHTYPMRGIYNLYLKVHSLTIVGHLR